MQRAAQYAVRAVVVKGTYEVRGYDLFIITFVQGKNGWIVGDPISNREREAAYELVTSTSARSRLSP